MSRPLLDQNRFRRLLRETVLLPIVTAIVLTALLGWQIQSLRSAYLWLDHSEHVIAQAHKTLRYVIDAQTGVRGYSLTRDSALLAPYRQALIELPNDYSTLKALLSTHPRQLALIQSFENDTNRWLDLAKASVEELDAGKAPAYDPAGSQIIDGVRDGFQDFFNNEDKIRADRAAMTDEAVRSVLITALGVTLLFGFLLAFRIRKIALSLKDNYQIALEKLEKHTHELLQSREWFSTTLKSIGDAVIVVDNEAQVCFLNPAAERMTGWTDSDAKGQPMNKVFNVVNEQTRNPAINPVERVLAQGIQVGLANHTVLTAKNGLEYPIEDSAAPIRDEKGNTFGVVLVFRDVQEKNRSQRDLEALARELEKAVSAREESLKILQILNRVGQRISAELDLDRLIQLVTDAATQLTHAQIGAFFYNVTSEQNHFCSLYALSGPLRDQFEKCQNVQRTEIFADAFSENSNGILRFDDARKDLQQNINLPFLGSSEQELQIVSYLAAPVISRSGEVLGGLFFGHTEAAVFTEREEELVKGLASQSAVAIDNARLYQRTKEAVQARDDFLSVASHELKTPLSSLQLQLQMTKRSIQADGSTSLAPRRLLRTAEICLDQTARLASLVEDLLDVSRIQSGHLQYHFEEIDISVLVYDAVEQLEEGFRNAHISVEVVVPPQILMNGDRFRLDQVIVNLLTNAMKYGNSQPIRIEVVKGDDILRLIVKDNGIGIAKEKQHAIFDRFERAVDSNNFSGMGLGLYISRQIVLAHQGNIQVESELGCGSTFIVTLPLNLPLSKPEESRAPRTNSRGPMLKSAKNA